VLTSVTVHVINFWNTIMLYTGYSITAESIFVVAASTMMKRACARASMFVDECPFAKDTSNIICETAPSKDVIEAAMLTMVSLAV